MGNRYIGLVTFFLILLIGFAFAFSPSFKNTFEKSLSKTASYVTDEQVEMDGIIKDRELKKGTVFISDYYIYTIEVDGVTYSFKKNVKENSSVVYDIGDEINVTMKIKNESIPVDFKLKELE